MKKIETFKASQLTECRKHILDTAAKKVVRMRTNTSRHGDRPDLAIMSWDKYEELVRKAIEGKS